VLTRTKECWPLADYREVIEKRAKLLTRLLQDKEARGAIKVVYRSFPGGALRFISDWGVVREPRTTLIGVDVPSVIPFVPFKRQRELIQFLHELLYTQESGLVEKSRDMGATWVCCLFSVWLFLFWDGSTTGWGSRDRDLVDRIGDPDSIMEKIRIQLRNTPRIFLPKGFNLNTHMPSMRILNPETGATIVGDIGDNIGRGGRSLAYFKDESAWYEHPEMIEAALADNAMVQVDVSSVAGLGNVFHRRREVGVDWYPKAKLPKGRVRVFVLDWRDHPGKSQKWYDLRRQKAVDEGLLHTFAQEVDRDYAAAVEGVIIQSDWVKAAIDAHIKLGFKDDGMWHAALDVADEGGDTNALSKRKGIVLRELKEWGEFDTGVTARNTVDLITGLGNLDCEYDCVGVGAGVKAEVNRLRAEDILPRGITFVPWNGGAEVQDKDKHIIPDDKLSPKNGDYFKNLKAQAWWHIARRFERTWRAINEPGFTWKSEDLISIDSRIPLLRKLEKELSQPTRGVDSKMKMVVNKKTGGAKSPNLADSIVMNYFPAKVSRPLEVPVGLINRLRGKSYLRRY
jgi:phage terminase large subunit